MNSLQLQARKRLNLAPTEPECSQLLPGREAEVSRILQYLSSFLRSESCGETLYISGVPGTGKTACVEKALSKLPSGAAKVVTVNGLRVLKPSAVFVEIWLQLQDIGSARPPAPQRALAELDSYFQRPSQTAKKKRTILVVDEVDCLVTRDQKVLYYILDWPTRSYSQLAVIAISNTMNLPEMMSSRCCSRLGFNRLDFHAYTASQIEDILRYRLGAEFCQKAKTDSSPSLPVAVEPLRCFTQRAIEFCARRIAGYTGDVRRGLHVCSRALERVHRLKRDPLIVDVPDIRAAEGEFYSSSVLRLVQVLPTLHRVVLVALLLCLEAETIESSTGCSNAQYSNDLGTISAVTPPLRLPTGCSLDKLLIRFESIAPRHRDLPQGSLGSAPSRRDLLIYCLGELQASGTVCLLRYYPKVVCVSSATIRKTSSVVPKSRPRGRSRGPGSGGTKDSSSPMHIPKLAPKLRGRQARGGSAIDVYYSSAVVEGTTGGASPADEASPQRVENDNGYDNEAEVFATDTGATGRPRSSRTRRGGGRPDTLKPSYRSDELGGDCFVALNTEIQPLVEVLTATDNFCAEQLLRYCSNRR